ncbi:MAG: phosphate acyltransferase PlsX [Clostridiales bacterium]|nr:phosphate acyltransferase PlsX [Clostridiales bacterium]
MYRIAVDLQGADNPPEVLADGVIRALADSSDLCVYLCGDKENTEKMFEGKGVDMKRLIIVDAPETILNDEDPVAAVGIKKNSSLAVGMGLCKSGDVGAFVTCGATGGIFVTAMKTLERIGSPVLLAELRKADGTPFCIADCGANVDCRAEKLVHFARMGKAYMKALGVENPRISLLSNGAEDGKGNAVTKKANALLREAEGLNFTGNIEGTDILMGTTDVVVCEGFSGNILLKTIEGSVKAVLGEGVAMFEKVSSADDARRDDLYRVFKRLYNQYDYTELGGGVLLGFKAPIIKGHGAATAETVYHIIKNAYALVRNDLIRKIEAEFSE